MRACLSPYKDPQPAISRGPPGAVIGQALGRDKSFQPVVVKRVAGKPVAPSR